MEVQYLVLLLFGVFSSTLTDEVSLDVRLSYLMQRTREMESRVSLLESRDTADVMKKIKDDLLQELKESTANVAEKLQNAESRLKKVDNHLLMEILQLKPMLKETVEKVRSLEEQVTNAMERERLKTHSLQVQMTELNSELYSVDIIRKNMSSMADNLRLQLKESLSNLTRNMRTSEDSSLNFPKDFANSSYVSKLDENLKILEKNTRNELQALRSELSPHLEKLEEKKAHCDGVLDMCNTLTNHSSMLSRLNQQLWKVESTCAGEPPSVRNGKPLKFDRKHKSVVQYECDQDFFLTGSSTVLCENGKWEGHPPICTFFDPTFTLMAKLENNPVITCYSDKYYKNIIFSRVVDTGSGLFLPKRSRHEGADLIFAGTPRHEMTGAYECSLNVDHRSAGIVVLFGSFGDITFAHQSEVATIGKTVELMIRTPHNIPPSKLKWSHNGTFVPSWDGQKTVKISSVQPTDAGIYEFHEVGRRNNRQALSRLIVRKCEKNRYGVNCEQECPVCYNGGVCHDLIGVCLCPVGFTGNNCEDPCGGNHISGNCENLCIRDQCRHKVFCKPDPFGCSCFPGFQGYRCNEQCKPGWYGRDCKQPCQCAGRCDIYTGVCS